MLQSLNRSSRRRPVAMGPPTSATSLGYPLWMVLLGAVLWASCDGLTESGNVVQPDVRVRLEQPIPLSPDAGSKRSAAAALEATYVVTLQVTDLQNQDFSPEPVTVQDTQAEARLLVTLPPENDYLFRVRIVRGSTLVAEGSALHYVGSGTRLIDVPIIPLTAGVATIGFLPGKTRLQEAADMVELSMNLYGTGDPIAGLVGRMDVEGVDPSALQFTGATIVRTEGNRLDLAWSWAPAVSADVSLGVLRVPRSEIGTMQFRFTSGNLRSVNPDGVIAPLQAVGASVEITP